MQYFIGYTLSKNVRAAHEAQTKELAEQFGIVPLHERSLPHLTFKAPFEFWDIETLSGHLKKFCQTQKAGKIKVAGYFFWDTTIAWKATGDQEALLFIKNLTEFLKSIPAMPADDREHRELNLHASVARFLSPEQFQDIKRYLQSRPEPKHQMTLDAISIYHKVDGKWVDLIVIPIGQKVLK